MKRSLFSISILLCGACAGHKPDAAIHGSTASGSPAPTHQEQSTPAAATGTPKPLLAEQDTVTRVPANRPVREAPKHRAPDQDQVDSIKAAKRLRKK